MRRIKAILFTLILGALVGCGTGKDVSICVEGNRMTDINRGQLLKIELEANATTGYIWELSDSVNKGVLNRVGKYRYIRKSRRIGSSGIQLFRFRGTKKGQARLVFEYRRPWEKEEKPARRYTVRVIVH
ncbi:MAG: protease inhibitor I42 family protein [Candidatus Tantalella remota]|nr:protease inhibitor I42 family protein [Candidatus Tantalella remota]